MIVGIALHDGIYYGRVVFMKGCRNNAYGVNKSKGIINQIGNVKYDPDTCHIQSLLTNK